MQKLGPPHELEVSVKRAGLASRRGERSPRRRVRQRPARLRWSEPLSSSASNLFTSSTPDSRYLVKSLTNLRNTLGLVADLTLASCFTLAG